ncbi:MAG: ferrochelatase [Hyphomicrobiales bacterium]|nr:MAG: ferrochelatase [Hyphomicrobiales bacterium]
MNIHATFAKDRAAAVTHKQTLPADRPASQTGRIGVLVSNLGTPDATDYRSVRRYLAEFLSDQRVIELPKWKWYPILYGIVLNTRPQKTGANYETVWNRDKDESPMRTICNAQTDALAAALAGEPRISVEIGMRYGNPSIESAVGKLMAQGCDRIVFFPLYPQYSATTTATANDQLFRALMKIRHQPAVRTVPAYYDEPAYIEALAASIGEHLAGLDFEPEIVLASYHGIPRRYAESGDPYPQHCHETTRRLRARLGWGEERLLTTFQSLFGKEEWIRPYTDETVKRLAAEGVKRIAIVNPGFSADCIETLEEIDGEVREIFMHAGGERFSHIPCLNDRPDGMKMIEDLVRRELSGWL